MDSQPVLEVEITTPWIALGQLLKLAGVAEDGVTARTLVQAGDVLVNGEPCTQRGRKTWPGDRVALAQGPVIHLLGGAGE